MLRLYHVPLCPFCRKIRIVLRERSLAAEMVEVQPWEHPDDLLRLNPASEAPVLVDGEQVICDSQAIADHSRQRIGTAASRERDDKLHRALRPAVGGR